MWTQCLPEILEFKALFSPVFFCGTSGFGFAHFRDFTSACSVLVLRSSWPFRPKVQGPLNGGVSNGGVSRSGLVLPFLSFFVLFGTFPIFLGFSRFVRGLVRGFSRFVLFLFLGLLRAPTRNSPERVRDTIWTFPEKSGKHPGLETPRFSFSQKVEKSPKMGSRGLSALGVEKETKRVQKSENSQIWTFF